jgi:glycine cleavage system aminomethyltransferase T
VSDDAIPYLRARSIDVAEVPLFAQRISYVGELGWELYGPMEQGARLWDALWAAGRDHGLIAGGLGAFDSLRLEKGYRLWGQDIHTEHDPFEAGLGFAVGKDKDHQGRAALDAKREPVERLACMTFDDPRHVVVGKEPIRHDGRVVSYVTSAGYGYTIGRGIVYGYLPSALATEGTAVEVEYFGERLAATVSAEPLFDPKGERLRG